MKKSLSYRIQEWLAERVSWVQYPNISSANQTSIWRYSMPKWKRFDIALISLAGVLVAGVFFVAMAIALYAFIAN